jgi:LacI family transcriptional regulator
VVEAQSDAAPRRPVTLTDVARHAGVSQPTASRVLNGSTRTVAENYRKRVLEAAQELGYTPNLAAQAIARGTSGTIALVIGGISDPYFSALAAALMKQAETYGLRVSIAVTDRRVDRELELVRELRGQQPRAIVLAGTGYVDPPNGDELVAELRRFEETGGKVVLISRTDLPFETVTFDTHEGARELAAELAGLGYRRALVLGSGTPLLSMQQRVDGFVEGFGGTTTVAYPEFSWAGTREFIRALPDDELAALELIFAITDDMALGAIAGLRDRGRRIPQDVAVAGFDDITTLRDVVPPLTTVHVPLDQVAEETVRRALDADGGGRTVPAHPVIRASTPPVRR